MELHPEQSAVSGQVTRMFGAGAGVIAATAGIFLKLEVCFCEYKKDFKHVENSGGGGGSCCYSGGFF